MTTLEASVLTANVPGRYSSWKEEKDDIRACRDEERRGDSDDNDDDNEHEPQPLNDTAPLDEDVARCRSGPNTGAKAVLADHRAHQRAKYERGRRDQEHREAVLRRIALGAATTTAAAASAEDGEGEEDGGCFDSFLHEYRRRRLAELKAQSHPSPLFGHVRELNDGTEMVDLLSTVRAKTVVLVSGRRCSPSSRLETRLAALARAYPRTRFLWVRGGRLTATGEERPPFEARVLPMILLYDAASELVESLPCADQGGGEDVEWWLDEQGFLST